MSGWTHIRDTARKAWKPHQCFLCAKPITQGETYVERFGYDDGRTVTMRMHERCDRATYDWDQTDWECFSEGELTEEEIVKGGAT